MKTRTHLKNTSSPRCERFCVSARRADEGVSSAIRRREATTLRRKTAATLRDMVNFRNTCVAPPRSAVKAHHHRRFSVLRKLAHIAGGSIFEMGSKSVKDKIKIIFAAQDAGAASALAPVIKAVATKYSISVLAAKYAVDIFKKRGIAAVDCAATDESSVVERIFSDFAPDVLIAGTSAGMGVEKILIARARQARVPSLAVVESWSNYAMRFSGDMKSGDFAYLPDTICVVDPRMKRELIAAGARGSKIVITGNPHFGEAAGVIVRSKHPRWDAIFISQPFSAIPQERRLPFDHFTVLRDWFARPQISKFRKILIRLHPRDDLAAYQDFLSREKPKGLSVSLNKDGDLYELLGQARMVVGMNSMVLLDAIMAGLKVIRYQPGLSIKDDIFPRGIMPKWAETYGVVAFGKALDRALSGKSYEKSAQPLAFRKLCQPKKAIARILKFAFAEAVKFKKIRNKKLSIL